ncbi:MAG TPA: HAD-IIIA family hydrolase [Steroidobacteraceae bacterium]|jgi:D-glycero-D-manno-heptose 1,7-bisphosphate phosphatase|nr:HAD-IIIA family hydrolase [Steroidobacteraceae bacterium]
MRSDHPLPENIRHLILDRDGVLNHEAPDHGYILQPAAFKWLPGALAALVALTKAGLRLSVATNQSAVGRGLMTQAQLDEIQGAMRTQAEAVGAHISGVYHCPHAPEAKCDCRKPAPGLLRAAVRDSGIPTAQTLMVGDDVRDVEAARAAGIGAVLVRTGKGWGAAAQLHARGETLPVFDDLAQLARILADRKQKT